MWSHRITSTSSAGTWNYSFHFQRRVIPIGNISIQVRARLYTCLSATRRIAPCTGPPSHWPLHSCRTHGQTFELFCAWQGYHGVSRQGYTSIHAERNKAQDYDHRAISSTTIARHTTNRNRPHTLVASPTFQLALPQQPPPRGEGWMGTFHTVVRNSPLARSDTRGAPHTSSSNQSSTAIQKWPFYMTVR
jgi:hypothetical protein